MAANEQKPIHWETLITLVGAAVLVGTELIGVSWAAGWALGGMGPDGSHQGSEDVDERRDVYVRDDVVGVEVLGGLLGVLLVYYFIRAALRHEPLRG